MARRKKQNRFHGLARTCDVSAGGSVEFENDLDYDKMKLTPNQCARFPVDEWLGQGSFASAYTHASDPDKLVVKFTGDAREAAVAARFLGKKLKGSVTIFDVAKLKGKKATVPIPKKDISSFAEKKGQPVFGLVTEKVSTRLSRANANAIMEMWKQYRDKRAGISQMDPAQFRIADWIDQYWVEKECTMSVGDRTACEVAAQKVFDAVDEQAENGVIPLDLHTGNWGQRADGSPVILDFGVSSAPGKGPKIALAKVPKNRFRRKR